VRIGRSANGHVATMTVTPAGGAELRFDSPAPLAATDDRAGGVGRAIGAGALGLLVVGLLGAGIGAIVGAASDPPCPPPDPHAFLDLCFHGLITAAGAMVGAGIGAWIGYPSAMAFVAPEPADVAWAWLGHLISTVIGLGIAALHFAVPNDGYGDLALGIAGGAVALFGAPIAFALALDRR